MSAAPQHGLDDACAGRCQMSRAAWSSRVDHDESAARREATGAPECGWTVVTDDPMGTTSQDVAGKVPTREVTTITSAEEPAALVLLVAP